MYGEGQMEWLQDSERRAGPHVSPAVLIRVSRFAAKARSDALCAAVRCAAVGSYQSILWRDASEMNDSQVLVQALYWSTGGGQFERTGQKMYVTGRACW